ncbi:hypothetical protein M0R45_030720 [Rubus argutus]|uniref:Uncharacterized protein n=1 Tax=Rubus argutus TaxID=59490 RepID=A0AAW1WFY0_RUBAR
MDRSEREQRTKRWHSRRVADAVGMCTALMEARAWVRSSERDVRWRRKIESVVSSEAVGLVAILDWWLWYWQRSDIVNGGLEDLVISNWAGCMFVDFSCRFG